MKTNLKRAAAALLVLLLLFTTGCNSKPAASPEAKAEKGRYLETEAPLPENAGDIKTLASLQSGSLRLFCNLNTQSREGPWYIFSSDDGGESWQSLPAPWLSRFENGAPQSATCDKNGNWLLFSRTYSDEALALMEDNKEVPEALAPDDLLLRVDAAGNVREETVKLPEGRLGSGLQEVFEAENGDLLISNWGGVLQVEAATLAVKNEFAGSVPGYHMPYLTYGDTLVLQNINELCFYSLETGERTAALALPAPDEKYDSDGGIRGSSRVFTLGEDGFIYIADRSGLSRCAKDGTGLEPLAEGGLTSMILPSLYFTDLAVNSAGGALALFNVNNVAHLGQPQLLRYRYSAESPAAPEKELRVYSLHENKTVRQAAGLYQRANPDTRVAYTVGLSDKAVTVSDALRTLSTELLAGKGPDILVLDGLPVDSYTEKGVLLEISALINQKTASGEWLANAANAFVQGDGKAYAVPARFSVPMITATDDVLGASQSLTQFADTIVRMRAESPEKFKNRYSFDTHLNSLLNFFYPICAPAWQNADGSVKEPEFRQFLTDLKKLYDLSDNTGGEATYADIIPDVSMHALGWAFDFAPAAIGNLNSLYALAVPDAAITKRGGGRLAAFGGQGAFLPGAILGINANSQSPEAAKSFLELTMSEPVQRADFRDGLPVNAAAFEGGLKNPYPPESTGTFWGFGSSENNYTLQAIWPGDAFLKNAAEMLKAQSTPCVPNAVVRQMLFDETLGYFTGGKTQDEAVRAFSQKLNLYLSE